MTKVFVRLMIGTLLLTCVSACQREQKSAAKQQTNSNHKSPHQTESTISTSGLPAKVIVSARSRTHTGEKYDPSYFNIKYPGGDIPEDSGVCTDVVIRAYRSVGIDLQRLVHEDMKKNFSAYPRIWGLRAPDTNIDHRRVPNLQVFFSRQRSSLPISQNASDYKPGDLVTWMLPGNLPHIGIVSDKRALGASRPLIIHNIGAGSSEDDVLFSYKITGHYRYNPHDT